MASLKSGKVKASDGGFINLAGAERALGNPSVNGYILSSQTDGTRSWISPSGGGGGISSVFEDTTPTLGGDLDLNSNDITGTGNIDITGNLDISGISTLSVTTATDFGADQLNISGVSTLGVTTATDFGADQLNISGVSTFSGDISVGTATTGVTIGTDGALNVSGISTFESNVSIGTGGTTAFFNTSSGNIGLGTNNPLQRFQIGVANTLGISTDQKIFTITSDGSVGIGTTNPVGIVSTAKLDVEGDVRFSNRIYDQNGSAGDNNYVLASNGPNSPWSWKLTTDVGAGNLDAIFVRQEGADVGTGGTNTTLDFYENFSLIQPTAGIASIRLADILNIDGLNVTGVSTLGVTTATTLSIDQLNVTGNIQKYDTLVGSGSTTVVGFAVTVAAKSDHRYSGGSGDAYYLDGIESPFLTLTPGRTYRFTLSAGDMSSHPFRFYLEADKTTAYTTNVTSTATYTEIAVTDTTPTVLHYQCSSHNYMGNAVQVNSNKVDTPYQIDGLKGANITGVVTATAFAATHLNISGVSTFQDNVYLGDSDNLYLGADNDLQLYHSGSESRINNTQNGTLRFGSGGDIKITNGTGLKDRAKFTTTSVDLFYDDSKKFETTTDGFKVVNGTSETAVISGPQNIIVDPSPDDVVAIATGNISGANVSTITGITTTDIAVGNLIQEVDGIISTGTTVTSVGVDQVGISKTSLGSASAEEFTFVNQTPTGVVRIKGDLYIDGTRTEINSTTLTIDDLNVVVASGATNGLTADGAGLTVDGASATLQYASTGDKWVFNKAPYYNTYRLLTTNDEGSGNGIDADTLDGQEGTYYLNYANFTNTPTIPTVNNGTLTLSTSGDGISGSDTFTANQSDATTFTVTVSSASTNAANTLVYRDASGGFSAGIVTATGVVIGDNGNLSVSGISTLGSVKISSGIITATTATGIVTYYGDGSALTGIDAGGGDGADFNTGLSTTKYHSAANDIDGFTAIGVSFPTTSGKTYLVPSIHITNVSTGDLYITSRIDYSGGENVPLTNKILIPYQGSLEIIDESLVVNPSDHLRFAAYAGIATNAAGVANGLDCFVSYEEKSDTNYIGTGSTIVDTIGGVGYAQTVFTSTTNPSVINTIVLTNYSDVVDADVSVSIFRNGTIQQGYLAYNLTVPQNSSVQILPRSKRLNASDTIVVNASAANVVGVNIAGKYIV